MKKIAIAEDDPDIRSLVYAILEDRYEITEYANGVEALMGLQANKPDLVLLDISLPEMDGTEVLLRIRNDPGLRNLPIVALTAHAVTSDRETFLAAGFDEYVIKPVIEATALLEVLERFLVF